MTCGVLSMAITTLPIRLLDKVGFWPCLAGKHSCADARVLHDTRRTAMNPSHPNYLVLLNTQIQAPLFDYEPNRTWLEDRGMILVDSVGGTSHAVLIRADESKDEVEQVMRKTLAQVSDSFQVIPISEFLWPSTVPDDEPLRQWLDSRPDWQAWRAAHG